LLIGTSQRLCPFRTVGTHAKTPTKEVKVEPADLSQLAIQDRKVVSVRVVGWLSSKSSKRPKAKLRAAAGAAAEAHVKAPAAALGPAMRAPSASTRLGYAHFGALAGVGKGQCVSTACKVLHKMSPLANN
jgi:hypothetical protein